MTRLLPFFLLCVACFSIEAGMAQNLAPLPTDVVETNLTPTNSPPTFHLTFAWTGVAGDTFEINQGSASNLFTNGYFFGTNQIGSVSNLYYGFNYWFAASSWSNGLESVLGTPFQWPWPRTNYLNFGMQAAASVQSNWTALPVTSQIINPTADQQFFRLAITQSNNLDPYQHPD